MVMDNDYLFLRCKNNLLKVSLSSHKIVRATTLFKKNGKARYLAISNSFICVLDFCDIYILDKESFALIRYLKIGEDASSDFVAAKIDDTNVYISIRNGKIGVLNIASGEYNQYDLCDGSSWEFSLNSDKIYIGTINGTLYEIDKNKMEVLRSTKIGNKNIYGIQVKDKAVYTISQDSTIKEIDIRTFDVVRSVRGAVKGMCRILGVDHNFIYIADQGISLWSRKTLQKIEKLNIPTGHFNKGACYNNGTLIGSEYTAVFVAKI